MCGIVAIAGNQVRSELLERMTSALSHRGPDDSRTWIGGRVGLGHRRLAIIDLDGSPQPMMSDDGRYVLAFNGEILNYAELRAGLAGPFRTSGDTEVLLRGLIECGPRFLTQVRGQFAFVLVDTLTNDLLAARDPLGILPLYYAETDDGVVFGSEIKALLPALRGTPAVDHESLDDYLMRRSVAAPYTLLAGIRKLLPGHLMRVDAQMRQHIVRYWTAPSHVDREPMPPEAAAHVLRHRLEDAVAHALIADVPVGAYLSGGIDSSIITALAARRAPRVMTFSAGFGNARVDELPFARLVADALGTDHHEVHVAPVDFIDDWARLSWFRDAPLSEPADVAVYRLARAAREHVTVVLSGEGSDELFAGYPKYGVASALEPASLLPRRIRRSMATLVERAVPDHRGQAVARAIRSDSAASRDTAWFAPFDDHARAGLARPSRRRAVPVRTGARGAVDRMLDADLAAWLPDNLLERGDRMSMAASLELRPPFLDPRVVDLALRMPARVKRHRGVSKWPIRRIARDLLPREIVERPKAGFRVPLNDWFRGGLRDLARDSLLASDSLACSAFPPARVRAILDAHDSGRSAEEMRIWTLLSLEIWHRSLIAHVS